MSGWRAVKVRFFYISLGRGPSRGPCHGQGRESCRLWGNNRGCRGLAVAAARHRGNRSSTARRITARWSGPGHFWTPKLRLRFGGVSALDVAAEGQLLSSK